MNKSSKIIPAKVLEFEKGRYICIASSVTDLQKKGAIAQLVEQRTENPCVAGSNPAGTTRKPIPRWAFFMKKIKAYISTLLRSVEEGS